jgi:tryptophan synthase alpha chain
MTILDDLFVRLRAEKKKAFIPFVTAGDPSLEMTGKILQRLDSLGCSIAEVGVPYSDPIADGPVIQASYTRALGSGIKLKEIFETVKKIQPTVKMPLLTMLSYAVVFRQGPAKFVKLAKEAGFCGAIIPDLLVEESDELSEICRGEDFNLIQLVTPTTPRERAVRIAQRSSGFIYFVSVTGITGERQQLPPNLLEQVSWLRERTDLPICIGFGISQPEHVRMLGPVADGLIVGSALVRRISESAAAGEQAVLTGVDDLVSGLLKTLREVS